MIAFRLLLLAIAGVSLTLAACGSSSRPNDLTLQNRGFQRLAEMNSEAIEQLDPSRTFFVLPVDPLEAHGPHLPSGTDVFSTEEITQRMARRVAVSLPDWTIVIMPTLSYGVSGANRIADRSDIRGTFSLRATTLRDIVADLGSQVADHGIRWLFVAYIHGAAHHHAALNDAADFVRDAYGVKVVNLGAVEWYLPHLKRDEFLEGHFTPEQRARIGFDIHAGMRETSRIMAIRPDLVSSNVLQLPDRTVSNWDELESFGHTPDFKGYWSAPALASSAFGNVVLDEESSIWADLVIRSARGEDLGKLRRYPEGESDDPNLKSADRDLARERKVESQMQAWLATRKTMIH